MRIQPLIAVLLCLALGQLPLARPQPARAEAEAVTYYVSASAGSDANNGLSPTTALRTIARVNSLALNPGDQVLFACGDTWRGEMLTIQRSGSAGSPIRFGSNPPGCANRPRLLGTQPVTGWTPSGTNRWVATIDAARFPHGLNQLFRNSTRLTMGRWPNLDGGDGGYAYIEEHSGGRITDYQLPAGTNWAGATVHVRAMRWWIVNRDVTSSSGTSLQLNAAPDCWGGCAGWGYFINNHIATLDQPGEWYYDKGARRLYLYSVENPAAATYEASVIFAPPDRMERNWGGINLGSDLHWINQSGNEFPVAIQHVIVDNFEIRGWFKHGISSPTNLHPTENSYLTLTNNRIYDVDDSGIDLWSWVYDARDGRSDGWRGGNHLTITYNVIDGANSMGIHIPSRETLIQGNTIRNIGLIQNLNEAGMGCGKTGGDGACTQDGTGLRIYVDNPNDSGHGIWVQDNRFENVGYHGIQTFGHSSTFIHNIFVRTCISKGDCGAINTFGSNVHDINVTNNLIVDTIGTTNGCRSDFKTLFGFGLYYDMGSASVVSNGNTVIRSTAAGMLYQDTSGSADGNTFIDNASAHGAQVAVVGGSNLSTLTNNLFYAPQGGSKMLELYDLGTLGNANNNRFYFGNAGKIIYYNGWKTLAEWRSASGKDGSSSAAPLDTQRIYIVVVNDSFAAQAYTYPAGTVDLAGNPVTSLTLEPLQYRIIGLAVTDRVYLPAVRR